MATSWWRVWQRLAPQPEAAAGAIGLPEQPSFADQVEAARAEWQRARLYFENVSDPDLVDHAIAVLHAAEKKYVYLVKQARQAGISVLSTDIPASF